MPKVGGREQRDSGKLDPPFRGIRIPVSSFILLTSVTKLRSNETNWLLCPRWMQCKVRGLLTLHCAWGFRVTEEMVFWVLLCGCFQRGLTLGGNTSPQRGQYSPMGRVPQWKGVHKDQPSPLSASSFGSQPTASLSMPGLWSWGSVFWECKEYILSVWAETAGLQSGGSVLWVWAGTNSSQYFVRAMRKGKPICPPSG